MNLFNLFMDYLKRASDFHSVHSTVIISEDVLQRIQKKHLLT